MAQEGTPAYLQSKLCLRKMGHGTEGPMERTGHQLQIHKRILLPLRDEIEDEKTPSYHTHNENTTTQHSTIHYWKISHEHFKVS